MALSDAQKLDVRRYLGYPTMNIVDLDIVYSTGSMFGVAQVSLTVKLNGLTAAEEAVLTTTFLANLVTLEQAIVDAGDDLDTLEAGPWIANPNQVSARTSLFNQWRRNLAAFLGFPPGPSVGGGATFFIRA